MRQRDFSALVEARIREAQARGLFDDLPGKGKPMPKDDLAGLPYEDRIAALIHRIAGSAPEEVELIRDIAELRDALAAEKNEASQKRLREALRTKATRLSILFESTGRGILLHSDMTKTE
jgi:hypothetical protein